MNKQEQYKATNGKIADSNIDFNIIMHEVEITDGNYVEGYNSGYEAGYEAGYVASSKAQKGGLK